MGGRRSLYAVSAVVVTVLLIVFFLHRRNPAAAEAAPRVRNVAVVAARTGDIARQLSLAGVFQPFQEIDVHGKVSGYIRKISVDIGDRVRQGQTLAVLEVPELEAQVQGAEAGVTRSEQDIGRARQELARARATYTATHSNYERLKQASDQQPGLVAAQELDDALAHDQAAAAQVAASKAAVASAEGQLGVSKADRLRVGSMVQYATITAPFSGVVTNRYADTGALVPAGTAENNAQAVVRLAQTDVLRLRMPVPEGDVPLVREGATVMVHVQATGQNFPAKVIRFTRNVSNDTRTMLTEVDVKNANLALSPGMYAEVNFDLEQKKNALVVPLASIVEGAQPAVYVVANGKVERRPVVLGIASASQQEIVSGLKAGEEVVVGGLGTLQPGEEVHAQPAPPDLVNYQEASGKEGN